MVVIEGIPQAVLDHGVDELLVAHASAPALIEGSEGSGAHVLGAAADDDVSVAGEDGTAGLDDGLHAGTADHADGVGGNGVGKTCAHADLAGDILAETGGQDAAEHHFINVLGSDVRALEGFLDNDGAQLGGGGILQGTAKGADRGTAAIHNIEFFHGISPFS